MKDLPEIKLIQEGKSILEVFDCDSIKDAQKAFNELRKQFDFPFWAASEYYVQDIEDPDQIVPLRLNRYQHYIADIFINRYAQRKLGRYVIGKSYGKIGVTTCVQAYILWRQIYYFPKNSYTCTPSEISINPLKTNLCRHLHRDIVPPEKFIFIPKARSCAYINTYRNPNYMRGIDLGFVHFADMSRWNDSDGNLSTQVFYASTSGVLLAYYSLVVLEGNIPKKATFNVRKDMDANLPRWSRIKKLSNITKNPYFLDQLVLDCDPDTPSTFIPILLEKPEVDSQFYSVQPYLA